MSSRAVLKVPGLSLEAQLAPQPNPKKAICSYGRNQGIIFNSTKAPMRLVRMQPKPVTRAIMGCPFSTMTFRLANTMRSCGPLTATTAPEVFERCSAAINKFSGPVETASITSSLPTPSCQNPNFGSVSFNDPETKSSDNLA